MKTERKQQNLLRLWCRVISDNDDTGQFHSPKDVMNYIREEFLVDSSKELTENQSRAAIQVLRSVAENHLQIPSRILQKQISTYNDL